MRSAGRAGRAILLATGLAAMCGCSGRQSALTPAGPIADSIHTLSLVMYGGAVVVTVLVTALMLAPFLRRGSAGSRHLAAEPARCSSSAAACSCPASP